jgi:catalase (peroxidase I)
MTKSATQNETENYEDEDQIDAEVQRARTITRMLFGEQLTTAAVHEIYEYLQGSEDEDAFLADFKRVVERCKKIHETTAPTPEQAFFLFGETFPE